MIKKILLILLMLAITACGGSSSKLNNSPPLNNNMRIEFQFKNEINRWDAGFADYPVDEEKLYELKAELKHLPSPLENYFGFNISGKNHSDDLFMFIKKRFSGFEPNTQYQIRFEIIFATNAPSGCTGVGGPPGEGVTLKTGATILEPLSDNNGSGFYLMNIDKGNQSYGGSDAIKIGDFSNSKRCEDDDFTYELKTLNNEGNPFSVFTDFNGMLWILFGTDSGFEATTNIYYVSGSIVATKM